MPSEFKFKVPRLFKAATRIAKSVKEEGSDMTELVKNCKLRTNNKALSALVVKVLENEKVLDQLIENTGILKDQRSDPWLFRVLITELLLGKKRLPVGCKPIQTVLAFGPQLTFELNKLKMKERAESDKESSSEASDDEALSEEDEEPPQKKAKQKSKKKKKNDNNKVSIEQPEASDDEALSEEEEEEPPQKQRKKNKVSIEQPESAKYQSTGKRKGKITPKKSQDSHAEEPKSAAKKSEDYISIKASNIMAKHGRNFGTQPKSKKFMSPKQRNIQKIKQFAKRAHSQTPTGRKFGKDKQRYFEVPSSV